MATHTTPHSLPGELNNDTDLFVKQIPDDLRRAASRLQFSPTYVVVGVYRLFTDKNLFVPAWEKCQHGLVRGASIALVWVSLDTCFPSLICRWHVYSYVLPIRP